MSKKVRIVSVLVVVLLAAAITIVAVARRSSNESSTSKAASTSNTTTVSQSTAPPAAAQTEAPAQAQAEAPAGPAAEAYETLTQELKALEQDAQRETTTEGRMKALEKMEELLVTFIGKYPGTPQAYEASFDAGLVSFTLQKSERAAELLGAFLKNATDAPRDKRAYAHFYLAEVSKSVGDYDAAARNYQAIVGQYADVNPQLLQVTQQNMSTLDSERRLGIGMEPIPFEVTGTGGEKISLAQYRGKVVLLDFWATWCAPCRQEMPSVKKVYGKYNANGFEIVGISLDRSRSDFDKYVKQNGMSWPQYFDGKYWQNDIARKYGITGIPATFLIDKQGKIRYKSLRGPQLEVAVEKLLKE
jgi:peroxiredoxin/TolA-binding protein